MSARKRKARRLQSPDGSIIDYPDLPTVQEWIAEGRVDRSYQIYDSMRRRWCALEEVPDLAAFLRLREASDPWERAHTLYLAGLGS